jgi:4-alpha-glucanotransferase
MSLTRLFRIPNGRDASHGAYVEYPLEALLNAVARETERARCIVVGEDLGNVPNGFRERMAQAQILSYRLLPFEREADGRFKPPGEYPRLALATAGTHDLPTLAGWALGRDIETRRETGLLPPDAADAALSGRRHDVELLLEALVAHGTLPIDDARTLLGAIDRREPDVATFAPLVIATYRYLGETPCALVFAQLDDAVVSFDQMNLPGTVLEYPNWRRKMTLDVESLAQNPNLAAVAEALRARVASANGR